MQDRIWVWILSRRGNADVQQQNVGGMFLQGLFELIPIMDGRNYLDPGTAIQPMMVPIYDGLVIIEDRHTDFLCHPTPLFRYIKSNKIYLQLQVLMKNQYKCLYSIVAAY